MTRKHFQVFASMMGIARALVAKGASTGEALDYIENALIAIMAQENSRFDSGRFREAIREAERKQA